MTRLVHLRRTPACGIDLGTANTLICSAAGEIVVNEPSVVTVRPCDGAIESVGTEAHRALGRNPGFLQPQQPVRSGVVTDLDHAQALLRRFVERLRKGWFSRRLHAAIAVPCGVTEVERFALVECARRAGLSGIVLVDQVLAAAHGCGIGMTTPRGSMVIDVGAGLVETGVFSFGSIVASRAEPAAGNGIDRAIAEHVRVEHRLLIGPRTAEGVKRSIAPEGSCRGIEVTGRCLVQGLPKTVTLCDGEIREAVAPVAANIVRVAMSTLEAVPPELSADLIEQGAVLTGGTALLPGLAQRLARVMQIAVRVDPNPLTSVVTGLSRIIRDSRWLRHVQYVA